ncbi:MAG: class I SAM-dependent methyltransferase [Elusimicrobia bacterium]|nr:class I SAM-dependent methyltransferase [Elusimicrobiota bacterium]
MLKFVKGKGYKTKLLRMLGLIDPVKEAREQLERDMKHPERLALLPYCSTGKGIDVGCGHRKTHDNCIGIDIIPEGEKGKYGCVTGKASTADVCTSGDDLHMFSDGELDFVVSRHNLEHYVDVIKTLLEWKRVLKPGGIMAVIVPDERKLDTIVLDPTHKHVFTPESFSRYIELIGGFEIIKTEEIVPDWSFMCVCRKTK